MLKGDRNLPGGEGKAHWDRMCPDRGLKGPCASMNQEFSVAEARAAPGGWWVLCVLL